MLEKHKILGVIKQKLKLTFELFPAIYAKMTKQDFGPHELWPFFPYNVFLCLNFLRLVLDVITLEYFEPFYGIEETIYTNNNFVSTLDIKELRFSFVVQCRIIEDIAMTSHLCSHP